MQIERYLGQLLMRAKLRRAIRERDPGPFLGKSPEEILEDFAFAGWQVGRDEIVEFMQRLAN